MIEILNDFERHLIEDGKRPKTVESYVGDVKGLMEYLSEMNVTFDGSLSRFYVTSYKNKLLEEITNQLPSTKRLTACIPLTITSFRRIT